MSSPVQELQTRPKNNEDQFFLDLAQEEFKASISRIEETAKYLITAVGVAAGLVLAGMQVKSTGVGETASFSLTVSFILWGASMLCAILVFFPMPYRHYRNAPDAIRRAFTKARWVKWALLLLSALTFAAGIWFAAPGL